MSHGTARSVSINQHFTFHLPRAPPRRAAAVEGGGHRVFARRSPAGGEERGRGDADRGGEDGEETGRGDADRGEEDGEERGRGDADRGEEDEEERGPGDADRGEEDGDFSQAAFAGHELPSQRRAARGEGGGSALHTPAEHGDPAGSGVGPGVVLRGDPCEPADEIEEVNRLKNAAAAAELLRELEEELKLLPTPPPPTSTPPALHSLPPNSLHPASGTLLITVSTRDEVINAVTAERGEEDGDFSQAAFIGHELPSQRRAAPGEGGGSAPHTPAEHGDPAGNVSSLGGGTGADPGDAEDEVDEINRVKNAEAAAELLRELGQELNLLPPLPSKHLPTPPPPTSRPSACPLPHLSETDMAPAPLSPASESASLLLTVNTCDDAREAAAAASDTKGISIHISPGIPLGAAVGISSILHSGGVQDVITNPGVLADKVIQANWLRKEISDAEDRLELLQTLLQHPWLSFHEHSAFLLQAVLIDT